MAHRSACCLYFPLISTPLIFNGTMHRYVCSTEETCNGTVMRLSFHTRKSTKLFSIPKIHNIRSHSTLSSKHQHPLIDVPVATEKFQIFPPISHQTFPNKQTNDF
ncbi:unnamed protein product [Dicrocoelium dendriticum]|nr:unnamed protein product [Dicrocoelium dendriticum]